MEFPELGCHCSEPTCHQLDFLPVKCDACGKKFCSQHWKYESHSCPNSHVRNAQVPVCPLCDQPVASARGTVPDIAVSAHIDRDCKSDPAVKKRSRCSVKHCKQKEFIKIVCDGCGKNYCLKHRHQQDHSCEAKTTSGPGSLSRAGMAALSRHQQQPTQRQPKQVERPVTRPTVPNVSVLQGGISEDEALRRALEESMRDQVPGDASGLSQEEQDRMLAEAIARSEREARRPQAAAASESESKNCQIS